MIRRGSSSRRGRSARPRPRPARAGARGAAVAGAGAPAGRPARAARDHLRAPPRRDRVGDQPALAPAVSTPLPSLIPPAPPSRGPRSRSSGTGSSWSRSSSIERPARGRKYDRRQCRQASAPPDSSPSCSGRRRRRTRRGTRAACRRRWPPAAACRRPTPGAIDPSPRSDTEADLEPGRRHRRAAASDITIGSSIPVGGAAGDRAGDHRQAVAVDGLRRHRPRPRGPRGRAPPPRAPA